MAWLRVSRCHLIQAVSSTLPCCIFVSNNGGGLCLRKCHYINALDAPYSLCMNKQRFKALPMPQKYLLITFIYLKYWGTFLNIWLYTSGFHSAIPATQNGRMLWTQHLLSPALTTRSYGGAMDTGKRRVLRCWIYGISFCCSTFSYMIVILRDSRTPNAPMGGRTLCQQCKIHHLLPQFQRLPIHMLCLFIRPEYEVTCCDTRQKLHLCYVICTALLVFQDSVCVQHIT